MSFGDSAGAETHNFFVNGVRVATFPTLSTGQNGFNPTPPLPVAGRMTINNRPIVAAGDVYAPHTNGIIVVSETALPIAGVTFFVS